MACLLVILKLDVQERLGGNHNWLHHDDDDENEVGRRGATGEEFVQLSFRIMIKSFI